MLRHAITAVALSIVPLANTCSHEAAPIRGRCTQWEAKLAEHGTDWDVVRMSRYMQRESHCQPGVVSRTNDHGLLQIHMSSSFWNVPMRTGFDSLAYECDVTDINQLYDADTNIECAHDLFRAFGYSPWG